MNEYKNTRLECCSVLVSGLESVRLALHCPHSLFPSAAPSTDHSHSAGLLCLQGVQGVLLLLLLGLKRR